MKKISKIILMFSVFLCSLFVFSACETGTFASLDVSYIGSEATFDEFSDCILVEYGTVLNLSKQDFKVLRVNTKNKKQKTNNFEFDASNVNNKRLVVGDYVIYFSSTKEDYKTQLIVRVYEKEVEKPTFAPFETEYDQNRVDIKAYLESQPGFDASSMIVEESSSSVTSATNAGTYTTKINLRYGHVWNTATNKTASIEYVWKINKKAIAVPKVKSAKTFNLDYDSEYNLISHTLVFEKNPQSAFYLTTNNTASNAGKHNAVLTIINDNYIFTGNRSVAQVEYEILPKTLPAVSLVGDGKYEYSGEKIVPNLENFISAFMQISPEDTTSVGTYNAEVGFKAEHANNFVFEGENKKSIPISFEILKKKVARPTLKSTTFTYNGTAPTLEIENFDENLFTVDGWSNNIMAGFYSICVSPKTTEIANNYAFEDSDYLAVFTLEYEILRAKVTVEVLFNVPDGKQFAEDLYYNGVIDCSEINVQTTITLYRKNGEELEEVSGIISAGEYVLVLSPDFDERNYELVDSNTNKEIEPENLQITFTVTE